MAEDQPPPFDPLEDASATVRCFTSPSGNTQDLIDDAIRAPDERVVSQGPIAAGGMGCIEAGLDRTLGRRVAIKAMHDELQDSLSAVQMFIREARVTSQLDHPSIVPVHELSQDPRGRLVFTMKLVEGRTLARLIRSLPQGPIEYGALLNLLDVVIKVCDAAALAHSRGVVHCDIKPDNIMVGDFGQVYLMDWGLARIVGQGTTETLDSADDRMWLGTPAYMPPEQARAELGELDPRSDVFTIGGVLYEIIKRHAPYRTRDRKETREQLVERAQQCQFVPLLEPGEIPEVPLGLIRIVERAMSAARSRRHASAIELKEELVRFTRGGGQFPLIEFTQGDRIVSEGDEGDAAYLILRGRCKAFKTTGKGEVELRTMGPGDVFGETAILSPGPRTASVVALDDVRLRVVTKSVLESEVDSMKPWMGSLIRALASRFRDREEVRATEPPPEA